MTADERVQAFAARYGTGLSLRIQCASAPSTAHPFQWTMEWRRWYGDCGFSDRRETYGDTLALALDAAEEWEAENDARVPGVSGKDGR